MKYTREQIEAEAEWCENWVKGADAADMLRQLLAENDALRESVKKANAQAEHFEREWYLRGDEVDALREDAERLRADVDGLRHIIASGIDTTVKPYLQSTKEQPNG